MSRKFDEMTVMENSIIPIYEKNCIDGSNLHEQVVNARELWIKLESKQEFANWFKGRIETYGFIENQDYMVFDKLIKNPKGGRPAIDYLLTLDTAKEIAMVENNEKGRIIRRYFIEAEKRYRDLKIIRARSKAERRLFTDVIRELVPDGAHKKWAYKNYLECSVPPVLPVWGGRAFFTPSHPVTRGIKPFDRTALLSTDLAITHNYE